MKKRNIIKKIVCLTAALVLLVIAAGYVTLQSEISAILSFEVLDEDFYAMEYAGDYGFERFLEQGGASSDLEVSQFVAKDLFYGAYDFDTMIDGFACSTLSTVNQEGEYLFGRNFDWGKCSALVLCTKPKNGYASISTANLDFVSLGTEFSEENMLTKVLSIASIYAPLDGINEKGLCVAILMIQDDELVNQQTDKADLTSTTAVRLLLDQAANVEEALALLANYDMHASAGMTLHYAISDAEGKSVVVEYIDNEMIVTQTDVVTNFYLAEGSKYGIGSSESHTRFDILQELRKENEVFSMSEVKDALNRVSKHNFGHTDQSTEWSIVYNKQNLEAVYYHRENFEKEYRFSIE